MTPAGVWFMYVATAAYLLGGGALVRLTRVPSGDRFASTSRFALTAAICLADVAFFVGPLRFWKHDVGGVLGIGLYWALLAYSAAVTYQALFWSAAAIGGIEEGESNGRSGKVK